MRNFIILLCLMYTFPFSQTLLWTRSFHNDISPYGWDIGYRIFEVEDNNLLVVGTTFWDEVDPDSSYVITHRPFFIIKTDENGLLISKNMYSDSVYTINGTFMWDGDTIIIAGNQHNFLWLNYDGDSIDGYSVPCDSRFYPYYGASQRVGDSLFFAATSLIGAESAIFLFSRSPRGEILSVEEYYPFGESFDDNVVPVFMSRTRDRGFIISGTTLFSFQGWVMKLDSTYAVEWISSDMYLYMTRVSSVLEISPDRYLCLGESGYCAIGMCCLSGDGDIDWFRYWHFDESDTSYVEAYSLIPTYDGNYVFCGHTGDYIDSGAERDAFIMKVDSLGNVIWQRRVDFYGRPDVFYSVIQTEDSGYVCTGYASLCTDPTEAYCESLEVCLAKFSKDGDAVWEETVKVPEKFSISVSPNPFNSSVAIAVETQNLASLPEIAIYDLRGNLISTPFGADAPLSPLSRGTNEQSASGASRGFVWTPDKSISSGIYFVKATISQQATSVVCTKRIVYLK